MWELLWFVASVSSEVLVIENIVTISTDSTPNVTDENPWYNYSRMIETDGTLEDLTHVIETEHGRVRGYEDDGIIKYFDIPYGAFSGERPFQESSKPQYWGTILENSEHTSHCPQINSANEYVGNNECLTLNIFKPQNADNAEVLFHIHESYFHTGSGDPSIYGPRYLVPEGIILVLPNYRLGPLGFLCLQNETAPGNAGLKDLTLALKWTADNIEAFGGNASKIVVSGSGAAAVLVEYLLLSNSSKSFISKAITESGSTLSDWALDRNPLESAKCLIDKLLETETNYRTENMNDIFEQINIAELMRAANGIDFRPCIELEAGFLSESPWSILQSYKSEIPYMLGSANHAAIDIALQHNTEESLVQFNLNPALLLPNDLLFENNEQKNNIGGQVKAHYFGGNNITLNDIGNLSQCFSDSKYVYPGIRAARLFAKAGSIIYFYEMSYGNLRPVSGAARGHFTDFVFSSEDSNIASHTNENGNRTQDIIRLLWVNFIKTGDPSTANLRWNNLNDVTEAEEEWLSIGDEVIMQQGFHVDRLKLWKDIYENHFIEHNLGDNVKPSNYITLFSLMLLFDFYKNLKL